MRFKLFEKDLATAALCVWLVTPSNVFRNTDLLLKERGSGRARLSRKVYWGRTSVGCDSRTLHKP